MLGTPDHLLPYHFQHRAPDAPSCIEDIMRTIDVLERNPLIGRLVRADLGELVIGRRARGYVAPNRYVAELDAVLVPAVRGQKEAGVHKNLGLRAAAVTGSIGVVGHEAGATVSRLDRLNPLSPARVPDQSISGHS